MHGTVIIFMVLEVAGKGASGFKIIKHALDCHHFHVFGSGWEGGLASESQEMQRTVDIFMVLEVGGRGAVCRSIIRNT